MGYSRPNRARIQDQFGRLLLWHRTSRAPSGGGKDARWSWSVDLSSTLVLYGE